MSVIYLIEKVSDSHWKCLSELCVRETAYKYSGDFDRYLEQVNRKLSLLNGKCLTESDGYTANEGRWLIGLEFGSEEDLILFKLTYN